MNRLARSTRATCSRRGSSSGVASSSSPAAASAVRVLVRAAEHAPQRGHRGDREVGGDRPRAERARDARRRDLLEPVGGEDRAVDAEHVTRPNWSAITSTTPPAPDGVKARPIGQQARRMPAERKVGHCPYRVTSLRARREPTSPPRQGTPNARPYCQGAKPSRSSIRTAIRGTPVVISPLLRAELASSRRRAGCPRMNRQPLSRSAFPTFAGCPCGRRGSLPPIARIPAAGRAGS